MVTLSKNPSVTVWELRYPQRARKEAAKTGRGVVYRMYRMRTEEVRALKAGHHMKTRVGGKSGRKKECGKEGRKEDRNERKILLDKASSSKPLALDCSGINGFFTVCKPCYFYS